MAEKKNPIWLILLAVLAFAYPFYQAFAGPEIFLMAKPTTTTTAPPAFSGFGPDSYASSWVNSSSWTTPTFTDVNGSILPFTYASPNISGSGNNSFAIRTETNADWTDNQKLQITIGSLTSFDGGIMVQVKPDNTYSTYYRFEFRNYSPPTFELDKYNNSTTVTNLVASQTAKVSGTDISISAGDKFALKIVSGTLTCLYTPVGTGVEVALDNGTYVDGSPLTGGKPGIWGWVAPYISYSQGWANAN